MSTVPAAMDALVQRVRNRLPNVQVTDGAPLPAATELEYVAVGHAIEADAVVMDVQPAGLEAERESYTIACLIDVTNGDEVLGPVRARAFELYDAFRAAIDSDRSLGGVVTEARIESVSADQQQNPKGASASIALTVRISAFL